MLVGIMGKMGSGKTLSMSILAEYLATRTNSKIYANYDLKMPIHATPVESLNDITKKENSIFCFDEMWLSMDARQWKDNVRLTQWVNQTRKKKMIVFYTTQHIKQIEMRARNATDILIYCEKKPEGIWLTFIDWAYGSIGKRFLLTDTKRFFCLYNTYEVLKPLQWERKTNNYKPFNKQKHYDHY